MRAINFNQLGHIPKTRKEALEAGMEYYYPDDPCEKGHISHRTVNDSECVECARIKEIKAKDTEQRRKKIKVKSGIEAHQEKLRARREMLEVWDLEA